MIPVAQLADDLPLDIISQDDEHPVPHVLSRTLTPYLQWSACVEGAAERIPPSQQQYLDPRTARDPAFFRHPTTEQLAAIRVEEEEEESSGSYEGENARGEGGDSDEVFGEEDETPEEESYSEYSEGEQGEEKEEDEEGEKEHEEESAGSEWEAVPEEALRTGTQAEDPEADRKREEIAAGKQLELTSAASLQSYDDPNQDPEPPRPEDGDLAATTPTPSAWRRSRSPSSPTHPPSFAFSEQAYEAARQSQKMRSPFSDAPSSSRSTAAATQSRGATRDRSFGRSFFVGRFRRPARPRAPFSRRYSSLECSEDVSVELDPTLGDTPEDIELRDVIQYHLDDDTVPAAERLQIAIFAMGRARSRVAQDGARTFTVPQVDLPHSFVPPRGALSLEERAVLEVRRGCLRCRQDGHTSSRCPYHVALSCPPLDTLPTLDSKGDETQASS
ncbi:hypothetical protein CBR_g38224 [Chara braunii]|uniref:CCHC-type domain-containing protein n=1 Tax=Chara braunii TaxID=69332 RepID=A0A388LPW6_CHABU|nr:hypothetical protein CBR_g38224 [Chara braunii]|eukprot:GBG84253.1 hypothetical protein CBR_g38224 [Chara braunii]